MLVKSVENRIRTRMDVEMIINQLLSIRTRCKKVNDPSPPLLLSLIQSVQLRFDVLKTLLIKVRMPLTKLYRTENDKRK